MAQLENQDRQAAVQFTGARSELFGILFRGYLAMVPTIGVYRFWMATWKRRFYWHNTVIDGEPLEYTGNAVQLLIGFLFAIGFFLPIYVAFFYLSTQSPEIAVLGYASVGVVLWFLTGYAIYRARDFRLSRTLWRGIRFDQKGNAWGYALRRFLWSILMVLTLGLIYPFMAGNLWRYRYSHTWYGDHKVSIGGSWRQLAGPYYQVYFGMALTAFITLTYIGGAHDYTITGPENLPIPGPGTWALVIIDTIVLLFGFNYFRARETSRMLSTVRLGEAALSVRVRARSLIGQFLMYCLSIIGALIVFGIIIGIVFASLASTSVVGGKFDPAMFARMFQAGWGSLIAIVLVYLAFLATFAALGEVILGFGYWTRVARGATISNADSLKAVKATDEDRALAGEGLADALNVGAY